jgi:hypothetical protein
VWGSETLNKSEFDVGGSAPTGVVPSKRELLANFDKNVAATRAALTGKTDAELMGMWSLKRGGHHHFFHAQSGGLALVRPQPPCPPSRAVERLPPPPRRPVPSMYGPSADEAAF